MLVWILLCIVYASAPLGGLTLEGIDVNEGRYPRAASMMPAALDKIALSLEEIETNFSGFRGSNQHERAVRGQAALPLIGSEFVTIALWFEDYPASLPSDFDSNPGMSFLKNSVFHLSSEVRSHLWSEYALYHSEMQDPMSELWVNGVIEPFLVVLKDLSDPF